jgi:hypothetical protein
VIVGKSIPTKGDTKCFGFVQRIEEKPRRRLHDVLDSQGFQANQPIVFLSDGADTVRNLQRHMTPNAEHILDWFHVTMRVTVMENLVAGLQKGRMRRNTPTMFADLLESVKWNVWHGKVDRSLGRAEELRKKLAKASAVSRENARKLRGKLGKFIGYIDANRAFISNYEKRYHAGKPISTSFVESTVDHVVSRRFVKKQKCGGPSAAATTSSSFARVSSTTSFDRLCRAGTQAYKSPLSTRFLTVSYTTLQFQNWNEAPFALCPMASLFWDVS